MLKRILNITGFFVLIFFMFALFFRTVPAALDHGAFFLAAILALISVLLVFQVKVEAFSYVHNRLWKYDFRVEDAFNLLAVTGGAYVTYVLSVYVGLGPVVAAGLVGVLIALIKPQYGVPAYCGAFVGMACPMYLFSVPSVLLAGVVAGVIFVISGPLFNGFGGKLGTIAFASCIIAGLSMGSQLQSLPVPGREAGRLIVFYSILAAVVTYLLSITMKHGPVMASGIVGLTAGLILPVLYPQTGGTLGVVVICSSFAGMSSAERFPRIYHMAIAGFFTGIVFLFSLPFMCGAGGKLGTIAFGSVIAHRGMMDCCAMLKVKLAGVLAAGRKGGEDVRDTQDFAQESESG